MHTIDVQPSKWSGLQKFGTETGETGNQRKNRDYPDHSSIKIRLNTQKTPGDPRKLAVVQTPAKIHQVMLVTKSHE